MQLYHMYVTVVASSRTDMVTLCLDNIIIYHNTNFRKMWLAHTIRFSGTHTTRFSGTHTTRFSGTHTTRFSRTHTIRFSGTNTTIFPH